VRVDRDWTVDRLAVAAGISKSYLSLIESGKRTAHWSLVMRIVHPLGLTLCSFLTEMETLEGTEENVRSRRSDRLVLSGPELDERGHLVGPASAGFTHILTPYHVELATEMIEIHLVPHSEWTPEPIAIPGHVALFGISGRLLLVIKGTEYVMNEGETMQYDGSSPHSLRNYTDAPVHVCMSITPVAL